MLCIALLTLIGLTSAAPVPVETPVPDWKVTVKGRAFKLNKDTTGAEGYNAAAKLAGVTTTFEPDADGRDGSFVFSKADGPKLKVPGHQSSAFVVSGESLYFAHYSPLSTGCKVIAYDLTTGKQTWEKRLDGIGEVAHSKYRNQVAIEIEKHPDAKHWAIVITSLESFGAYIEVLDLPKGKQLAHKVFKSDELKK